jgi:hypothetical protein
MDFGGTEVRAAKAAISSPPMLSAVQFSDELLRVNRIGINGHSSVEMNEISLKKSAHSRILAENLRSRDGLLRSKILDLDMVQLRTKVVHEYSINLVWDYVRK